MGRLSQQMLSPLIFLFSTLISLAHSQINNNSPGKGISGSSLLTQSRNLVVPDFQRIYDGEIQKQLDELTLKERDLRRRLQLYSQQIPTSQQFGQFGGNYAIAPSQISTSSFFLQPASRAFVQQTPFLTTNPISRPTVIRPETKATNSQELQMKLRRIFPGQEFRPEALENFELWSKNWNSPYKKTFPIRVIPKGRLVQGVRPTTPKPKLRQGILITGSPRKTLKKSVKTKPSTSDRFPIPPPLKVDEQAALRKVKKSRKRLKKKSLTLNASNPISRKLKTNSKTLHQISNLISRPSRNIDKNQAIVSTKSIPESKTPSTNLNESHAWGKRSKIRAERRENGRKLNVIESEHFFPEMGKVPLRVGELKKNPSPAYWKRFIGEQKEFTTKSLLVRNHRPTVYLLDPSLERVSSSQRLTKAQMLTSERNALLKETSQKTSRKYLLIEESSSLKSSLKPQKAQKASNLSTKSMIFQKPIDSVKLKKNQGLIVENDVTPEARTLQNGINANVFGEMFAKILEKSMKRG